jgi:hypothetical protein
MKAFVVILLFSAVLLYAKPAADVSGTWTGMTEVKGDNGLEKEAAYVVLKQTGAKLTGTAGPDQVHQVPIQDGTIKGKLVSFHITSGPVIYFKMTQAGDGMSGEMKVDVNGKVQTGTITLRRK